MGAKGNLDLNINRGKTTHRRDDDISAAGAETKTKKETTVRISLRGREIEKNPEEEMATKKKIMVNRGTRVLQGRGDPGDSPLMRRGAMPPDIVTPGNNFPV